MSNSCPGSGSRSHVSDLSVITRKANCPKCGRRLRITIPSSDNGNTAKFPKHSKQEKHENLSK